jgi:hypothetical protein
VKKSAVLQERLFLGTFSSAINKGDFTVTMGAAATGKEIEEPSQILQRSAVFSCLKFKDFQLEEVFQHFFCCIFGKVSAFSSHSSLMR